MPTIHICPNSCITNKPSIDSKCTLENSEAGGLNLLSLSQGSVIDRVMKMGHMMNRST